MAKRVFEKTADECAMEDEDMIYEYQKRHAFRFAFVRGRTREAAINLMVEENNVRGGFFYKNEDGFDVGPFETRSEARNAAPDLADEDDEDDE